MLQQFRFAWIEIWRLTLSVESAKRSIESSRRGDLSQEHPWPGQVRRSPTQDRRGILLAQTFASVHRHLTYTRQTNWGIIPMISNV
jgi:hypothetical protein